MLDPVINLTQYVELWEGPGWERIGGYWQEEARTSLWPWLRAQGCVTAEDDQVFGEFLVLLGGKRQLHLRPGLRAERMWPHEEVASLSAAQVADEVRTEVNRALGTVTLALLVCSTCPVRRDCLAEAFREIRVDLDPLSDAPTRPSTSVCVEGIWGGTTYVDRERVRGVAPDKAVKRLERTFPARLQRQAAAFRRRLLAKPRKPNQRERRVLNMLEQTHIAVTRRCAGCRTRLPALARSDARFCSGRCRVAAHRAWAA